MAEALDNLGEKNTVQLWEALEREEPTNVRYRRGLATAYNSLANDQAAANKTADSLEMYRKALTLFRRAFQRIPEGP